MPIAIKKTLTDGDYILYWCAGCGRPHHVPVIRWNWNGSLEKPTLSPSVRHFIPRQEPYPGKVIEEKTTCHYFIREGRIEYCGDCDHALAGQTLPMEEIPTEWLNE